MNPSAIISKYLSPDELTIRDEIISLIYTTLEETLKSNKIFNLQDISINYLDLMDYVREPRFQIIIYSVYLSMIESGFNAELIFDVKGFRKIIISFPMNIRKTW